MKNYQLPVSTALTTELLVPGAASASEVNFSGGLKDDRSVDHQAGMVASGVLAADLHAMPQEQSQTGFMAGSA